MKSGVAFAVLEAEAIALREMKPAPVPNVIALSAEDDEEAWLLLQWLEPGAVSKAGWTRFAQALAELHRRTADRFGWQKDNFIGSQPQSNQWNADWPSFWRDQRILPQLKQAKMSSSDRKRIEQLVTNIEEIAAAGNEEGPSLLHGDLWGGNVHGLESGDAAMIDPSTYYGHREVDLAMAALFGGFSEPFWAAYEEAWRLLPGHEARRSLYQLYYMLAHVNLFGGSYVSGTMSLVARLGF